MFNMKFIFLISGENPELAKAEIELFANAKIIEHNGSSIVAEAGEFEKNRLAYTKVLCRFLFSCKKEELLEKAKQYAWKKVCRQSFYVHIHHAELDYATQLADIIWNALKKPVVSFDKPKTEIDFIFEKDKVFCGLRLHENKEKFEARKAHRRPGFSPISLHPKLARALVNMTGVIHGQTLLDPFCGTGGILLEAGLMGLKPIGSDIDERMLEKAKTNLNIFKIRGYKLIKFDARKIKLKCSGIATDPPYGKASSLRKENTHKFNNLYAMKKLYSEFLEHAYKMLKKGSRLAIIFPNRLSVRSKFKTLKRTDVYIHKGLTRTINVLEKN